jgi:RHS repeat-associated protein
VEIQAFGISANDQKVQWLISDHLGTPRMILDQTGSLANMKRHDYLPFGEELFAPTSGRSAAQGYAGGDGVRQQFTQKERDNETGLDYFNARYYSNVQGRFASTDPILMKQDRLRDPQELNLYAYVRNNPLKYIDPDGEDITVSRTQQYEFIVERRAEDNPELLKQVRVSVTEVVTERYSDDGKLLGTTTQATATAENTQEAKLRLVVAAINDDHLIRTEDGGATWKIVDSEMLGASDVTFTFTGIGWVVGRRGAFYRSTDQGKTWDRPANLPESFNGYDWTSISFAGDKGLAVGKNGVIAITSDGGASWSERKTNVSENFRAVRLNNRTGLIIGSQKIQSCSLTEILV